MNAFRSVSDATAYQDYLRVINQDEQCPFCDIRQGHEQYVAETDHFVVMTNKFPYENWDSHPVSEHLMIIPKNHVISLAELSEHESKEYLESISRYESTGYNIYARTTSSKTRSIKHQHTHLIKL